MTLLPRSAWHIEELWSIRLLVPESLDDIQEK